MKALKFAAIVSAIAFAIPSANIYAEDDYMQITLANGEEVSYKVSDINEIKFINDEPNIVTTGEAVDLGLSVKWASMNIGAEKPSDYGDYFAWGETAPKDSYTEENSKWDGVSYSYLQSAGVIDSNGNLTAKYDAATVNWGTKWRMPTLEEIKELLDKCKWEWTTQDGHNGYKVTGPNGNSIFMPAAGWRDGDRLRYVGSNGDYWSSTAYSIDYFAYHYSYFIHFKSSYPDLTEDYRSSGQSVRPVSE